MKHRTKVAVVNGLQDTMDMLETALHHAGYDTLAVQARDVRLGIVDLPALTRKHGIGVIVYDIAIPYGDNWAFINAQRANPALGLPPIVITTTNKRALEEFAGGETPAIEIIGKPYDVQALIAAVHRAAGGQTGREP